MFTNSPNNVTVFQIRMNLKKKNTLFHRLFSSRLITYNLVLLTLFDIVLIKLTMLLTIYENALFAIILQKYLNEIAPQGFAGHG